MPVFNEFCVCFSMGRTSSVRILRATPLLKEGEARGAGPGEGRAARQARPPFTPTPTIWVSSNFIVISTEKIAISTKK